MMLAAACLAAAANSGRAADVPLNVIALAPDQRAPSTPAAVYFAGFDRPQVSDAGQVMYGAYFQGPGVKGHGLYLATSGVSSLFVRNDTAAPGTVGPARFEEPLWQVPYLVGEGKVAFTSKLVGGDTTPDNDYGLWSGEANALQLVARKGDAAPGLPAGVTTLVPFINAANSAGQIVYSAVLEGPGVNNPNYAAFWRATGTNVEPLVYVGMQAPTLDPGVQFSYLGQTDPTLNNAGVSAFAGRVQGPGVTFGINDVAVWTGVPGALDLVVRSDDPVPGAEPGMRFRLANDGVSEPSVGESGEVAFLADFVTPIDGGKGGTAIFLDSGGGLEMVARTGDAAPGLPAGVTYHDLGDPAVANGQVLFRTSVLGPGVTIDTMQALYLGVPGAVELLLRSGDPVAGHPELQWFELPNVYEVNDAGQIALHGFVQTSTGLAQGIFVRQPDGSVLEIARAGEAIEVAPGDFRVVRELWMSPQGQAFNNQGDLAFRAFFEDSSDAVVLAHVPEPCGALLAGLGAMFVGGWRFSRARRPN